MCAGMVAGVCVAGGVSAAAGAISLSSPSGGTQGTQSVTVVSGTTANPVKTQGWFSNDEEKEVEAYCWDCDHAPSRGWNWNWGCKSKHAIASAAAISVHLRPLTHPPPFSPRRQVPLRG